MLSKLAALAVKAAGWRIKIDATVPSEGAIIIGAPHTSNWGFIWKSGLYRIALASQLPLQLGYVDKATHTAGLGPVLLLSGSMSADMEQIRHFYRIKGDSSQPSRAPSFARRN